MTERDFQISGEALEDQPSTVLAFHVELDTPEGPSTKGLLSQPRSSLQIPNFPSQTPGVNAIPSSPNSKPVSLPCLATSSTSPPLPLSQSSKAKLQASRSYHLVPFTGCPCLRGRASGDARVVPVHFNKMCLPVKASPSRGRSNRSIFGESLLTTRADFSTGSAR